MDTWILKMIRAVSLRRVVAWGLSVVCGVLLATSDRRYLANFLHGPFELGPAALDSIHDVTATPRYFARVSGSKILDTGIRQYKVHTKNGVETGRSESGAYYALVVGDKFLIVKADQHVSSVAEGELVPWPSDLQDQVFASEEMRALRGRFYPFYVSNETFRLAGYIVIGLALVFAFFFVRHAVPAWQHLRDPSAHPLVTRMASWGDPLGVAVAAEREFGSPRYKGGDGWRVGDTYLLQSKVFRFDVLRLQDLLWAYKNVTKHSFNFIPTGKTYQAILACYGGSAMIDGGEKQVDAILAFAHQRVPWAVPGYTPDIATLFKTKAPEFARAVEERRSEWEHKAGQRL